VGVGIWVSVVLCCDESRFGGCDVSQGCVCDVPGMIRALWCWKLCFDGF